MGTGYRTESYGGSGVRKAEDVLMFEIFELGNSDAILTFLDRHADACPDGSFVETCRQYGDELAENGYVDDLWEDEKRDFVSRLLAFTGSSSGLTPVYALWLADRDTVKGFYGGTDGDVMPPRATMSIRGFPFFRIGASNAYRYG